MTHSPRHERAGQPCLIQLHVISLAGKGRGSRRQAVSDRDNRAGDVVEHDVVEVVDRGGRLDQPGCQGMDSKGECQRGRQLGEDDLMHAISEVIRAIDASASPYLRHWRRTDRVQHVLARLGLEGRLGFDEEPVELIHRHLRVPGFKPRSEVIRAMFVQGSPYLLQ